MRADCALPIGNTPLVVRLGPQLSQNSVNLGFGFMQAIFGTDALDAGETYDITLQAFDHGKIVAQVHDSILLV